MCSINIRMERKVELFVNIFKESRSVAVSQAYSHIYIANQQSTQVFSQTGQHVLDFSRVGNTRRCFDSRISIFDNFVLVTTMGASAGLLQIFTLDGFLITMLYEFKIGGEVNEIEYPMGVLLDEADHELAIFLCDYGSGLVYCSTPLQNYIMCNGKLEKPREVKSSPHELFITELRNHRIIMVDKFNIDTTLSIISLDLGSSIISHICKRLDSYLDGYDNFFCIHPIREEFYDSKFPEVLLEKLTIESLRGILTSKLQHLKHQEADLTNLDIKIGLLIRNQITLKDVINTTSKVQKRRNQALAKQSNRHGINNYNASSRNLLDACQHLFYLLQTNPKYIAKVLSLLEVTRKNEFLGDVVLALYNYGTNPLEMYHFMTMIQVALHAEIDLKEIQVQDISTMNSLTIKILIKFTRESRSGADNHFKELLRPLVHVMINSPTRFYLTPVDIFKQMVNQMESRTGTTSLLPYEVTNENAIVHLEVQEKMSGITEAIKPLVSELVKVITENVSKIPYGIRYMAMTVRKCLIKQFHAISEDKIVKTLSNLVYHRYINPMIVNPESYGLIELDPTKGTGELTVEQRKNVSIISKVLQSIAINKTLPKNDPLEALNPFIEEKYQEFKVYMLKLSIVQTPEEKFGIDEVENLFQISKPIIRLSAKEIICTHKVLLDNATTIVPDLTDPIHEILADLAADSHIRNLVGEIAGINASSTKESSKNWHKACETNIALTLSSKHDWSDINEPSDARTIFVQTKEMCVDLLRIQEGETLTAVLDTPPTEAIRKKFDEMIQQQIQKSHSGTFWIHHYTTALHTMDLNIDTVKNKIKQNLEILEEEGLVSKQDHYQEIFNAIAKDITHDARHLKMHRVTRKRLTGRLREIEEKEKFHEERYDFYQQYINCALENMARATALRGSKGAGWIVTGDLGTEAKPKTIRYTAWKLYNKGVILEIEGIQRFQYRSINFVIRQVDMSKFEVHVKFPDKLAEKTILVIRDLLQLQYDGVAVCKIGNQVKVNVNLLIFLINKKLYGKQVK